MEFNRRIRAGLIALLFTVFGALTANAVVDRAVCSASDAGGTSCTVAQLKTAINEEVNAVDGRAPMDLTSVSGTDTYVGSVTPTLTSYSGPQAFWFKPTVANTGASTLNINSIGAKALVTASGTALGAGDLLTTNIYLIRYYATADEFRVITSLGAGTAPASAPFITQALSAALTAERVYTEGAAIDCTDGGANSTFTCAVDLTELNTAIFGSGTFTTLTFDAGAVDPVLTFGSGLLGISAVTVFTLDDEMELRFNEEDANGSNYKGFKPPAAITANTTCTLEDDANFIPDSCVGDGSDDDVPDAGEVDDTALAAGAVDGGNGGEIADASVTFDDLAADSVSASELNATGVEAELEAVLDLPELQGDLVLTTQTSGNYVKDVADGTGIDGTAAAEGATYTPTLDLTEINSATFGSGTFTTLTFDAGAVDPVLTFASGSFLIAAGGTAPVFGVDDQGELRLYEEDAGGANYISFAAPAAIGSNRTCVLVDGAAPIPDSCVGDGTDAGAGAGSGDVVGPGSATDNDIAVFDSTTGKLIKDGGKTVTTVGTGIKTIALLAGAGTIPSGGGIAGCTAVPAFDSGSNDIFLRQCAFSASADNAIYWTIPAPKSSDETVDLQMRIDWTSATTTDATDDVIWTAACVAFSNDDAINGNAFPAVDTVTDTQTAAGDFLSSANITAITPAGTWAEGDMLVCRVTRDADAAGDNFNGTAELISAQLYLTTNANTDN